MNHPITYILITGANGQLGNELRLVLADKPRFKAFFTDVQELDITDGDAMEAFITAHHVDCIVNCAAYTAVDAAEQNSELCRLLNAEAPALMAQVAARHGVRLIHISTDYVFDGENYCPYREDDPVRPQSVYGITKEQGERAIMKAAPESVIIRTAWLYSPHGKNFVKTMLALGRERDVLRVVADQVGTPTYALDLARAIVAVVESAQWVPGIYHFTDEGVTSWYDFTKAIHHMAGIDTCRVDPCRTDQYPTPARRPHYSVLDKSKIKQTYHIEIPYWVDSLRHCIDRLAREEQNN